MAYVDKDIIKTYAEAADESEDTIWTNLAASASLIFDQAAKVPENFFAACAKNGQAFTVTDKLFDYEPSGYYNLPPFVAAITPVVKLNADGTILTTDLYAIKDGILIYPSPRWYGYPPFVSSNNSRNYLKISAAWGFAAVPADVQQAVIEQAVFMYRRKDSAFTELSGVSSAVVVQQLSPTCKFVADKYREKYLTIGV